MPTILITGASGGIGAALARAHAARGVHLVLWGRNQPRLEALVDELRALGATAEWCAFDLADIDEMIVRLQEADARLSLDLAYFNAGMGGQSPDDWCAEPPDRVHAMVQVNFTAPVVGASLLANRMAVRRSGHIVLVSSMADSFPLPMSPTYCGTKAGLTMFGEALAIRIKPHKVSVSVVSPGFIDTLMNRGEPFAKPFLMQPDAAAAIIVRKVARRRERIIVPWPFAVLGAVAPLLPRWLVRAVLSRA